jgi:bla regulator protein BlaR1
MSATLLVNSIGWTLVHFLWQGALIGCAAALALTVMRNARAEQRYLVACTALVLCLVWPALELAARLHAGQPVTDMGSLFGGATGVGAAVGGDSGALAFLQSNLLLIVGVWALCAVVLALRMALGLMWIARVARMTAGDRHWQGRIDLLAERMGVSRSVRLRVVDNLASPITAGWWRPVVLVPASLISGMPADLLEALLAHEMGHIKRLDYLVNIGQNVVETLLFYHPAVWWISGCIRSEREQIADNLAAGALGEPRRLALALSELEKFQFSSHHLAQAANGGDLMLRIKRLLRPDTQALNWKAALPVLGLAAAFLAGCANTPPAAPKPVVHVKAMADFNSCAKPEWPKAALRNENTGTVTLKFLIGVDGKVKDSTLFKSSGFSLLDEAARSGISKCSFKPATDDGVPVEEWMAMQYVWTLK